MSMFFLYGIIGSVTAETFQILRARRAGDFPVFYGDPLFWTVRVVFAILAGSLATCLARSPLESFVGGLLAEGILAKVGDFAQKRLTTNRKNSLNFHIRMSVDLRCGDPNASEQSEKPDLRQMAAQKLVGGSDLKGQPVEGDSAKS